MPEQQPKTVYLKDYQPPEYLIDKVELYFWLGEEETRVSSNLYCRKNPAGSNPESVPLVLDGEAELVSVSLDGRILVPGEYAAAEGSLTVHNVPEHFELKVETRLEPDKNTSLEGLYRSSGNFCTQCEAEGFRNITYYLDRSDVMAQFTTTIEADLSIPVLLSNGNLVKSGTLDNGRHFATWNDPFLKPCYLFAVVAGNLVRIEDVHRTRS
ncbi:MAG: aminopeptidase N, partial [Desulfobulbaceae bacterium]|nr:aminopeptidase N [Desulfobulbaceae bacterium]